MKYFIKTFGCQMNVADSERISGWYQQKGWQEAGEVSEADEVIINSCSVRQSAENRVYGLVNNLSKLKRKPKIILTGCMLRLPKRVLIKKLPAVDEFRPIKDFYSGFPLRKDKNHAWIPISNGCNNFCTYCVVPYARGKEISRPLEEIVCEVEELVNRGYKEITLLGQNVNSYGKDLKNFQFSIDNFHSIPQLLNFQTKYETPFAILLEVLHQIEGVGKISFITSNPWDLNDEIIEAISLPKIDRNLHLPVQSGDDEILKKMNRKYTKKKYLDLVKKIKKKIPEIKISTDIIVGFPGETEEQFMESVKLAKKVGFDKAYIAIYSPREGTAAFKLKDNISFREKKKRWKILDELINHNRTF
ncbi:MiaB/RimO family radical SAM methylthiotransferase [Candidatus Microgenomates bacterium]|jgi:tRNA-2-methylthio-N6-dimethylallyladenosine synthase|nr:MAG: MiaB/RimO family radical SAM methylthiotransferase [Candidatus Microgenomates bacterium]